MPSVDRAPSLVAELRGMKSRIAEIERQTLGVARQIADDATAAVNAVAETNVVRATPTTVSPTAPGSSSTMPEMSITLDPEGDPVIVFFNCSLQNPAAGFAQVGIELWVGATDLNDTNRAMNIGGNFEVVTPSLIRAVTEPALLNSGPQDFNIRWAQTAGGAPAPYAYDVWRSFALLRIGRL